MLHNSHDAGVRIAQAGASLELESSAGHHLQMRMLASANHPIYSNVKCPGESQAETCMDGKAERELESSGITSNRLLQCAATMHETLFVLDIEASSDL